MANAPRNVRAIWLGMALMLVVAAAPAWAKDSSQMILTANGKPIRKVYIYTDSLVTTDSAATQVTQDTCLTVVTHPRQADAILQLGMVLPMVAENGGALEGSGSSKHRKKKHKSKNSSDREVSVTCSDGDESGNCNSNLPTGAVGPEQDARWMGNVGGNQDVTLVSTASEADELWEPDTHKKQSWSDQLRVAVGCPVCPGEKFNPRRDNTYQAWMQATCPSVLAATK